MYNLISIKLIRNSEGSYLLIIHKIMGRRITRIISKPGIDTYA